MNNSLHEWDFGGLEGMPEYTGVIWASAWQDPSCADEKSENSRTQTGEDND